MCNRDKRLMNRCGKVVSRRKVILGQFRHHHREHDNEDNQAKLLNFYRLLILIVSSKVLSYRAMAWIFLDLGTLQKPTTRHMLYSPLEEIAEINYSNDSQMGFVPFNSYYFTKVFQLFNLILYIYIIIKCIIINISPI